MEKKIRKIKPVSKVKTKPKTKTLAVSGMELKKKPVLSSVKTKTFKSMDSVVKRRVVKSRSQGTKITVRVLKNIDYKSEAKLFSQNIFETELQAKTKNSLFSFKKLYLGSLKVLATSLVCILTIMPMFQGFEAHLVRVRAELVQIDPPVLTPPGDQIPWHNPIGGTNLTAPLDVNFSDPDPDATHIYFTYATGTDPSLIVDPICGENADENGGGGLKADVETAPLTLLEDTVIKAIACNGNASTSQKSLINTKIYTFTEICPTTEVDFPENTAVLTFGIHKHPLASFISSNDTIVNGNILSNGNISAAGGGSNRKVFGDAFAGGGIALSSYVISGVKATNAPSTVMPDIQAPHWENVAKQGGTVNGSLIFPDNLSGIEIGPIEITGSVEFGKNNSVLVKGPIHIRGNLKIKKETTITQDPSFGNSLAIIIVDGKIEVEKEVSFLGNGSGDGSGAFLLVSKSLPIINGGASIYISEGNEDLEDVILFAMLGDVHIKSGSKVLAIFAKRGTSESDPAIDLESETEVGFRKLPETIACGENIPQINSVLINEFMPNPVGSDQGATSTPELDGEWVEIFNGLNVPVDVNGWALYDNNNTHELLITPQNVNASSTIIQPKSLLAVYRDGDSDFELNNSGGDTVRLFSAPILSGGILTDSHIYTVSAPENKSFARIPDGTANWIDPKGTPGEPNNEFFVEDLVLNELVEEENNNQNPEEEEVISGSVEEDNQGIQAGDVLEPENSQVEDTEEKIDSEETNQNTKDGQAEEVQETEKTKEPENITNEVSENLPEEEIKKPDVEVKAKEQEALPKEEIQETKTEG